jgi:hypothetical protein
MPFGITRITFAIKKAFVITRQLLSVNQKAYNKLLASISVSVENVMAGVKRLSVVKDKIRLKRNQIRDQVMLIACGLHNLRIARRKLL